MGNHNRTRHRNEINIHVQMDGKIIHTHEAVVTYNNNGIDIAIKDKTKNEKNEKNKCIYYGKIDTNEFRKTKIKQRTQRI